MEGLQTDEQLSQSIIVGGSGAAEEQKENVDSGIGFWLRSFNMT